MIWTHRALTGGGKITLESVFPGKTILRAKMSWPGETTIYGSISTSAIGALESLEKELMQDAAKEMQENGSA